MKPFGIVKISNMLKIKPKVFQNSLRSIKLFSKKRNQRYFKYIVAGLTY